MLSVIEPVKPLARTVRYRVRKHILRTANAFDEWFHDKGDETLILRHALNERSVVFEVGGYQGNWSSRIINLYNPDIYVFEPVESFYSVLANRFNECPKVKAYQFGLSDRDETAEFSISADGSGRFGAAGTKQAIQLQDICRFVSEHNIPRIDLIQINIEGAEYQLLQRMLDAQLTRQCGVIQVQFHRNVPDAELRREQIRRRLAETHSLLYDYPFVWEAWKLREQLPSQVANR